MSAANDTPNHPLPYQPTIEAACKNCFSDRLSDLSSELAIHFSGIEGLKKPIVWSFPKIRVCLRCGFTEFTVPQPELEVLSGGRPVEGAIISSSEMKDRILTELLSLRKVGGWALKRFSFKEMFG